MAKRFDKHQNETLKLAFAESDRLNKEKKMELMKATGLDMEQIASWFNRKRTRNRSKESIGVLERTNVELQQALNCCQEREIKLQVMLQESTDKILELEAENLRLRQCVKSLEVEAYINNELESDYYSDVKNVQMVKRFETHQIDALKISFDMSENLTKHQKIELVAVTGLDVEQITSWFSRKRARKRAKESVMQLQLARTKLQEAIKLSQEKEIALQKAVQEKSNREIELQAENKRLKQRLDMAEGNKQYGSFMTWFGNDY